MKKIFFALCLCVCAAAVLPAQARKGGTMYVAVKTVELKSGSSFFSSTRGTLSYGATVSVLQVNDNWAEVKSVASPSVSGWTTVANLSSKRIVSGTAAGASASEVALAGKGFNQEIENSYKAGGRLNYADVDKTEALQVSRQELRSFINEGKLFMGDK